MGSGLIVDSLVNSTKIIRFEENTVTKKIKQLVTPTFNYTYFDGLILKMQIDLDGKGRLLSRSTQKIETLHVIITNTSRFVNN